MNMMIPIRSCVLMPESNHMTQFVDDNAELVAILTNGNSLSSISSFAHKRTTSKDGLQKKRLCLIYRTAAKLRSKHY